MDGAAIRVATVRGIPIRAHVTFLIVLPFFALGFARVFRTAAEAAGIPPGRIVGTPLLWGFGVALALFLSVLVHELAHSLYALRKGGRVREITLTMIGGVSQLVDPPKRGRDEAVMALVGPLTSLGLGLVFGALYRALLGVPQFAVRFALFQLFYLNVVLGLFNLLPAFPMDGGRILRGVLAEKLGFVRATRIAAGAGKAFAVLFGIAGFLEGNIFLMVIAFFVYLGAESESRGMLVNALLGHLRVRDVMVGTRVHPVEPSASVFELGELMLRERRVGFPVVENGRVLGVVGLQDVERVPPTDRARLHVSDVFRPVAPVRADDEAADALRAFASSKTPLVPVVGDDASLVGVLTGADVSRALELGGLEASQHPRARSVEPSADRRA